MERSLYGRIMVTRKRNFRGRTHGKQMAVPGESALPGQLLNMAQWYECLPLFVFFSSFLFLRFLVYVLFFFLFVCFLHFYCSHISWFLLLPLMFLSLSFVLSNPVLKFTYEDRGINLSNTSQFIRSTDHLLL